MTQEPRYSPWIMVGGRFVPWGPWTVIVLCHVSWLKNLATAHEPWLRGTVIVSRFMTHEPCLGEDSCLGVLEPWLSHVLWLKNLATVHEPWLGGDSCLRVPKLWLSHVSWLKNLATVHEPWWGGDSCLGVPEPWWCHVSWLMNHGWGESCLGVLWTVIESCFMTQEPRYIVCLAATVS